MTTNENQSPIPEREDSAGKKVQKVLLGFLAVLIFAALGVYVAGMIYFKDRFFVNTRINGVDASGKTVEEMETQVAQQIASYQLTIEERDQKSETITAEQIGYHYVSQGEVQRFQKSQRVYLWPLALLEEMSYTFDSSAQYDEEKMDQAVDSLQCLDESRATAPQDAFIDFLDGRYHVIPEVEGNLLERERTVRQIREAVDFRNVRLSLEEKNCYRIPNKRKNDDVLNTACKDLNTMVGTNIVYQFGSRDEILNGEIIREWLSVDEAGAAVLDADQVYEYVYQLAQKYNTADRDREFVTNYGASVSVSGGSYGWLIDQEAEAAELIENIRNGFQGERYAVFAQTAVSWENSDLGDSYVEIDLGGQHVWMYLDGQEIVSTDCVSGNMSRSDCVTPPGTYTLYWKESPSVLKGENNEYESKVTYWMPFNGGIGLHDATWRSSFGGNIYQTNGSHGCINLPFEAAARIYENIYDGMPIICYY